MCPESPNLVTTAFIRLAHPTAAMRQRANTSVFSRELDEDTFQLLGSPDSQLHERRTSSDEHPQSPPTSWSVNVNVTWSAPALSRRIAIRTKHRNCLGLQAHLQGTAVFRQCACVGSVVDVKLERTTPGRRRRVNPAEEEHQAKSVSSGPQPEYRACSGLQPCIWPCSGLQPEYRRRLPVDRLISPPGHMTRLCLQALSHESGVRECLCGAERFDLLWVQLLSGAVDQDFCCARTWVSGVDRAIWPFRHGCGGSVRP
jgi:hypothetical protein